MKEISNLDLKVQLTNEYLRNGGIPKINDVQLLDDIINTKFDTNGKAIPESITSRMNAFMSAILMSHTLPPFFSSDYISEYASIIQKSLFFDQINIETEEQFDELFEKYKNRKDILFRGQREAKWRLYSTLQRFWIWDGLNKSEDSYSDFLKKIIESGKVKYSKEILEILEENHIDSLNDVSVLGFLQHHECPTPLLDWTYSFKNALFFALDNLQPNASVIEIENYLSVYFIEEAHFEAGSLKSMMQEGLAETSELLKLSLIDIVAKDDAQKKEMQEHFKERSYFDKSRFKGSGLVNHMTKIEHMINIPISYFSDNDIESGIAFSLANSKNIQNQEGVFTWNSHSSKPFEILGNEQYSEAKTESDPDDYRFCECYNINKILSGYIRGKLEAEGVTNQFIYPDKEINTNHIFQESKKAN